MEINDPILKCIIVDDEPNAIDVIIHHLAEYPHIEIAASFTNALDANSFLKATKVDLIFLDIQMPGISGIDLLRSLKNPPPIFLTTAYRHYAPEAFELNVLDYLLKPISGERFKQALEKFEIHVQMKELEKSHIDDHITIRANRSNIRIKPDEILYLESKGDYIKIHFEEKHLLTKQTLKNFSTKLPSYFRQIHRSFIVNSRQIDTETNDSVKIKEIILPVSRNFR